jgi:phage terminase large subunit-like protein
MSDFLLRMDARVAEEECKRRSEWFSKIFPETGPLRRELYSKHMAFFAAGGILDEDGKYRFTERAFIAANRVGKSEAGSFEITSHLTGRYPDWWPGRRFETPVNVWVAGDTGKTTRDILQQKFMGPLTTPGTGMLPKWSIVDKKVKSGVADALENVWVRHVSGGLSTLTFKSYDQRREAFQGTAQHLIWLDEECPEDIYTECLLRVMVLPGQEQLDPADRQMGSLILTFTPLLGLTPVVLSFMPGGNMIEGEVVTVAK